MRQLSVAAERAVLADELERLDVNQAEVTIEGRRHGRVLRASETYTSAAGPITVQRTLYRAAAEQTAVPLELRAGIIKGVLFRATNRRKRAHLDGVDIIKWRRRVCGRACVR